jgi:lipopolysaccharide transport system ATP-binding protein
MPVHFGGVSHDLPAAAVIGCIGENDSGVSDLFRCVLPPVVAIEYTLDGLDALRRLHAEAELDSARRKGGTVLLASHDRALLRSIADEVWWIADGAVRAKGHPHEVLRHYEEHVADQYRSAAAGARSSMAPSMRRGDGRAHILALETLDGLGTPTTVWRSGERASVRVCVRFDAAVDDPVVGIMIRTRIGMEVYGTNTELENVRLGPCAAGECLSVVFTFECSLCPQAYTVTAASHDPNGVWHDWLEDAVAFTVTDTRYTAGVANLRANVTYSRG